MSSKCPKCAGISDVKQSRMTDCGVMRRRRKCRKCATPWTTYEVGQEDWRALQNLRDAGQVMAAARRELKKVEVVIERHLAAEGDRL
jgi:transcriptional regulator NrdR family protein